MMHFSQSELAKKYATAYLNVHGKEYAFKDIRALWRAAQFLSEHHTLLFYLSLSIVDIDDKERFIDLMIQKFNLFGSLKDLFLLMIKNKCIFLASSVLQDMYGLYKSRNNICDLRIVSSVELTQEEVDSLVNFFKDKAACTVRPRTSVDPSLIAGVRLQTDTFLWEHSIAKQLRELKQDLAV